MSIFNIKKDLKQIQEAGKRIRGKLLITNPVLKSIFIIIKWLIILIIIYTIIWGIWSLIDQFNSKDTIEKEVSEYILPENIGGLQWSVERIYDHGTSLDSKITTGKFIEVVFLVENNELSPKSTPQKSLIKISVRDDKERIYNMETNLLRLVSTNERFKLESISREGLNGYPSVKEIKPGIPYRFSEFFEVSSDSENFNILVDYPYFRFF